MKITIAQVARDLKQGEQTVRCMIRNGRYPFATAVKRDGSERFTYTIFPRKYAEFIGGQHGREEKEA